MVEEAKKICVFEQFQSYFPILQVYNSENYQQTNRVDLLKNVLFGLGVTIILAFVPNEAVLAIWYLFELGDLSKVIVAVPLLLTLFHMFVLLVSMVTQNRRIQATFARIQNVVNQRK